MSVTEVLTIESRDAGESITLDLHGDLDLSSAPLLDEALRDAESRRPPRVIVDCSDLDFIDSSGLSVLIEADRRAEEGDHALVLSHVGTNAARLLALTGLSTRFRLE